MISIIAAIGRNNVIGKDNSLPWRMPADMKHFVALTAGKTVIMGRKTFESIGKPLKERKNIILSRAEYHAAGCVVVSSIEDAIKESSNEAVVIGGASVYRQFLPRAQKMYLTLIDNDFEGDAYFPSFSKEEWGITEYDEHKADAENPHDYAFITMERKSSGVVMQ